jgi:serine phosphatase RsbU (regulator of sigma subunit)
LRASRGRPVDQFVRSVRTALAEWTGETTAEDDVTILAVDFVGPPGA